jgi:hypothetical protein
MLAPKLDFVHFPLESEASDVAQKPGIRFSCA